MKSRGLEKELAEAKGSLRKESDDQYDLRVAVGLVCDDLGVTSVQEMSSLVVCSF